LSILSILLFTSILASCSSFNTPTYEQKECQFYTESFREIECGILKIPEDRGLEEGSMIELHFTIIRSNYPEKAPDPLLVLHGCPSLGVYPEYDGLLALHPGQNAADPDLYRQFDPGTPHLTVIINSCSKFIHSSIKKEQGVIKYGKETLR
jgi:hypothetical protein